MKVFFYVQHLLGIGHLKRAATLAAALAREGFEVTLASGGPPVAGVVPDCVKLLQLPPASAEDASFKHLVDDRGNRIDAAWQDNRKNFLLKTFNSIAPDILIVELFPFGRRQLAFELLPLLELAKRKSRIVCSVRDIIQDKPERHDEMAGRVAQFFDLVLVHGDAGVAPFPLESRLGGRVRYTGYIVGDAPRKPSAAGRGEVLVSAGGGAVGELLLRTAIESRRQGLLREHTWRVISGVNGPDLSSLAETKLVIERHRHDFASLLENCALSISQAGYNTVMETLQARACAVLVPFRGAGESEQAQRARLLAERGLVEVVDEGALSPATLAAAALRAQARGRPVAGAVDLGGARRAAAILRELAPA
jgi:predicted glycosyltransferase